MGNRIRTLGQKSKSVHETPSTLLDRSRSMTKVNDQVRENSLKSSNSQLSAHEQHDLKLRRHIYKTVKIQLNHEDGSLNKTWGSKQLSDASTPKKNNQMVAE